MTAPLHGRIALVTGASRGIGRAAAEALHADGATVIGVSRSLDRRHDDRRVTFPCNLVDSEAVTTLVEEIVKEVGVPDILVNNAGALLIKPVQEIGDEEFRSQLEANLVAPFLVARALVPHFTTRGGGHLITIGSVADHQAFPGNAAYAASKYGLRGLHDVLALELKPAGVRSTLIAPSATDTSLWDALDPDNAPGLPPRSAMLRADDVAAAVCFAATRPAHANVDLLYITSTA